MNELAQIRKRLKEIAADLDAYSKKEVLTEEEDKHLNDLLVESEKLEAEKVVLEAAETRTAIKQRADDILAKVTSSTRVTPPGSPGQISRVRDNIQDDPKRGFRTLADFITRVTDAGNQPRGDSMLMQVAAGTGLNSSVNTEGAVLVPPAFSKSIWDRVLTRSNSLLSYCDQVPVDMGVESVTVPAINETSRADGSRMGGVRGYWKGELTAMTESRPAFREVKLTPHELYVFAYISDKLLRSSPGTASRIFEVGAADEIAFKVGDAIIEGDGLGKPMGVLSAACTVSVSKETSQTAATIVPANIRKMMSRLHVNWRQGAVWFVNQDVLPVLEAMEFSVGTGGVPAYMPPGGLSETPYSRLYGLPVIPIEYCSTVGTVGDIILANLSAYAAAIKGMVDSAYSIHLKFDYAQTAYRVIFEMDGQPWLNSAITPFKGSNTTSPFVTLATRS